MVYLFSGLRVRSCFQSQRLRDDAVDHRKQRRFRPVGTLFLDGGKEMRDGSGRGERRRPAWSASGEGYREAGAPPTEAQRTSGWGAVT